MQRPLRHLLLLAAPLVVAGCGSGAADADRPTVVATTPQAADIARRVAPPGARVVALIPAGADPHDYEVRPRDVEALAAAVLVVRSGGDVDQWLTEAIEAAGGDAPVLTLLDEVGAAEGDPHWWHDPRNGARAAEAIAQQLGSRRTAYAARLRRLDAAIADCWSRVPRARRKLVTTHQALGYYARRYGLQLVGAVVPATTTQGQASAGDVDALVRRIRADRVPAVFPEAGAPADVEAAVAREAGVELGRPLHTDSLAADGPAATYAGSLVQNTRALVDGLTRGKVECSLPR